MPAALAIPLISAAIGGGASVAGAAIASHGAGKAAKTQADATTQALDFEKQQYAAEQARLQPYRDLGGAAMDRMSQRLGGGSFNFANPNRPSPGAGGAAAPAGGTFSFASPQAGQMVTIRNPRTGEARQVPAAQAEILKQRGGQVVG